MTGNKKDFGDANIVGVVSNKAEALALERAKRANIATTVLSQQRYPNRYEFDRALMSVIDDHEADLIVLAGFMRILTAQFVNYYVNRLVNVHPSLLPKYKGQNTHRRAIEAGDSTAGATVYWGHRRAGSGGIIRQVEVLIHAHDSKDSLKQRVLEAEHDLYPAVIRDLSLGVVAC